MSPHLMTWTIAALATAGVILRPFNLPEAIWAVAGAVLLIVLGLISIPDVLTGVAKGTDVYLFLFGMMILAEIAREEGLFDWLAAVATRRANGSARRLFLLTYGVGTLVTIFLSNDATAVVLTPAVGHSAPGGTPTRGSIRRHRCVSIEDLTAISANTSRITAANVL
jgi:arsenical pump membrane protein